MERNGLVARGSIPLRFQGGGGCASVERFRSLAAQTGWLVISNKNKVRYADIYKEATRPFTNHPVCAAKEGDLFINGAATSPWKGGEAAQRPGVVSKKSRSLLMNIRVAHLIFV